MSPLSRPWTPPTPPLLPLSTIGPYKLTRKIGSGAFATVYEGILLPLQTCDNNNNNNTDSTTTTTTTTKVAIKIVEKSDTTKCKALKKEAKLMLFMESRKSLCDHDHEESDVTINADVEDSTTKENNTNCGHHNILQMRDWIETSTHVALVVDFANGGDMIDVLENVDKVKESTESESKSTGTGTLSSIDAARVIKKLVKAVAFLHSNRIAHRDIKFENCLVVKGDQYEEEEVSLVKKLEQIWLCDFGLAVKVPLPGEEDEDEDGDEDEANESDEQEGSDEESSVFSKVVGIDGTENDSRTSTMVSSPISIIAHSKLSTTSPFSPTFSSTPSPTSSLPSLDRARNSNSSFTSSIMSSTSSFSSISTLYGSNADSYSMLSVGSSSLLRKVTLGDKKDRLESIQTVSPTTTKPPPVISTIIPPLSTPNTPVATTPRPILTVSTTKSPTTLSLPKSSNLSSSCPQFINNNETSLHYYNTFTKTTQLTNHMRRLSTISTISSSSTSSKCDTPSTYSTTKTTMDLPASGSDAYLSPEIILRQPHDPRSSDIWALGVLTFLLVTGRHPFIDGRVGTEEQKRRRMFHRIAMGDVAWEKGEREKMDSGLRRFLEGTLVRGWERRVGVEELVECEWLRGV
ncbi:hypothetical protein HDU76_004080 [Blyttiomyces sp. JEL0837]|nr:hypothetical protein HDU76_004080 [Blyttiomyces sp. JEL0837]